MEDQPIIPLAPNQIKKAKEENNLLFKYSTPDIELHFYKDMNQDLIMKILDKVVKYDKSE